MVGCEISTFSFQNIFQYVTEFQHNEMTFLILTILKEFVKNLIFFKIPKKIKLFKKFFKVSVHCFMVVYHVTISELNIFKKNIISNVRITTNSVSCLPFYMIFLLLILRIILPYKEFFIFIKLTHRKKFPWITIRKFFTECGISGVNITSNEIWIHFIYYKEMKCIQSKPSFNNTFGNFFINYFSIQCGNFFQASKIK